MGTAEIESAINEHVEIAESAVIGYPHDIKGQGIFAYVTMKQMETADDALIKQEIVKLVRKKIGPIATPDIIMIAPDLPKTRSGKIMRRILRKIAANEYESLGDTSTLNDPSIVDELIARWEEMSEAMDIVKKSDGWKKVMEATKSIANENAEVPAEEKAERKNTEEKQPLEAISGN